MAESRTQIVIALIGLAGVLGAAVISKYGLPTSLAGRSSASGTKTTSGLERGTHEQSADSDLVNIRNVNPPGGTVLQAGKAIDFKIDLSYRLQSLDNAALSIDLDQHDNSTNCTGETHIHASQHVPITRGEHQITVAVPYRFDAGKPAVNSGSISVGAKIWSDFDNRQLLKSLPFTGYCWTFN